MFRGQQAVRFYSRSNELAVVRQVQEALGRLGRVAVERSGSIHIEPGREFHSRLTQTAFSGCLRRRNREYEVRITYCCRPTPVNWAVMALGTLPFLLGWVALLVPLSTKRRVAEAVRRTLRELGGSLVEASGGRFSGLENEGLVRAGGAGSHRLVVSEAG